jgi:hypothetical protein
MGPEEITRLELKHEQSTGKRRKARSIERNKLCGTTENAVKVVSRTVKS